MRGMSKKKITVIRFVAPVFQIRTLVDGGTNVTFSLSNNDLPAIAQLLECKQPGILLEVAAVPVKQAIQEHKKTNEPRRKQRYPYRTK